MTRVGTVQAIFRYPVKSTAGESLDVADVEARGLVLDRTWAVRTADGGIGSGKTSRRFRRLDGLLTWRSGVADDTGGPGGPAAGVWLEDPEARRFGAGDPALDEALSAAWARPLTVEHEAGTPYHDDSGVHLVTTSSLRRAAELTGGTVDARRARPNLVLATEEDGFVEDGWEGAGLTVGPEVVLRLGAPMPRCAMVDAAHRDVAPGPRLLKTLGREHGTFLGLKAEVERPGTVRTGDEVRLLRG
ncbi:MOSC domain-containing protein [Microlunatus flavus]|uniref:MOSC domain-containing protein n=1 Tax=Microlunatus flavus TaxID=1036181 RepID=A0A1H9F2J0_9ACTN|nr:MOSC N-terminal beta barrel domain-containing protein [Microlunatus flavus]SEQ32162.1 hypothetical protein SAMN05421756_103129 [Microlunatus flavus]